ncbi:hypothetical protein [Pedobacter sp. Hv1]|uniref:hypothetical protein n=1 Tax=Pedobacter sp. Hv1 TaxID=1740090 RepID=UPI0006D89CE1|nr:hypothetical protein [Pedobacter sp. Hv1]KQC01771.1 hypothetical protein AQF98_05230 [Pedobacter sp. Hv1]
MEKKVDLGAVVKKKPVHKKHNQAVVLRLGGWKELFEADQCKLIIARALNKCTWYGELILNGYLITNSSVYLLIKIEEEKLDEMLTAIYEYLKMEVTAHHVEVKQLDLDGHYHIDNYRTEMLLLHLFEIYALYDEDLIKLMTGKSINLPYTSPTIEKLKKKVHTAQYCSAIDYTGAKSPVIVQLI